MVRDYYYQGLFICIYVGQTSNRGVESFLSMIGEEKKQLMDYLKI